MHIRPKAHLRSFKSVLLPTLAASAASLAQPAFAQEAPIEEDTTDEIVVTGSIVAAQESSIRAKAKH